MHYLTENYRSTRNIINGANALISRNSDRMKTGHPLTINASRKSLPAGGKWEELDPESRGRVQILEVSGAAEQTAALLSELQRTAALANDFQWSDIAILSKTHDNLHDVRALCEANGIPVARTFAGNSLPNLSRIREIASFLEACKLRRAEFLRATDLEALLEEMGVAENYWWDLLRALLSSWKEETADSSLPVSALIDRIYEELAEARRDRRIGDGVFCSTVHGAKGLEFPQVFILDGNWGKNRSPEDREEERRLFYVAMTRAKERLCIFARRDGTNPYLLELDGDFAVRKRADASPDGAEGLLGTRYLTLGMADLMLGFAGRFPENHPIHGRLGRLGTGSPLFIGEEGRQLLLYDSESQPVAKLSRKAYDFWAERLGTIRSITVLGMLRRKKEDEQQDFQASCRTGSWEIPWAEVVSKPGKA
ncbi:MAG: 3'-5' exonuclease [Syntrophobacteraceae bacterium]